MSLKRPSLIIVSAPSGGGKTTLCTRLIEEHPQSITRSVSTTTRALRGDEVNGREYHFITQPEFDQMVEDGKFAEWAVYAGNHYGTSKVTIEEAFSKGLSLVLNIDVQGAESLRRAYPDQNVSIFITPPSMEELELRLRRRGTDDDATIKKRLVEAQAELDRSHEFTHVIVNDDLDQTYTKLKELLGPLL